MKKCTATYQTDTTRYERSYIDRGCKTRIGKQHCWFDKSKKQSCIFTRIKVNNNEMVL